MPKVETGQHIQVEAFVAQLNDEEVFHICIKYPDGMMFASHETFPTVAAARDAMRDRVPEIVAEIQRRYASKGLECAITGLSEGDQRCVPPSPYVN